MESDKNMETFRFCTTVARFLAKLKRGQSRDCRQEWRGWEVRVKGCGGILPKKICLDSETPKRYVRRAGHKIRFPKFNNEKV